MASFSHLRFSTQLLLLASLAAAPLLAREPVWAQVHAEIEYVRTGTLATAQEGSFTFNFTASIDQLMQRRATKKPGELPSYSLPGGYERACKVEGRITLNATASQYDEATRQTLKASASLGGKLQQPDELQLLEVTSAAPLGEGLSAKFHVAAKLQGTVESSYPRMPGVSEQDAVFLWPTPVAYRADEGFVSEGDYDLRPVLGPRPKDEAMGMVYDLMAASNGLEALPGIGGFRPPAVGCVTQRNGDSWKVKFQTSREFDTLTGGKYTDTITVTIEPVPTSLPLPQRRAEAE